MEFFVYALYHPITKDVFYVGQTMDLEFRIKTHFSNSHNPAVNKKIASIRRDGFEPEYMVLDTCTNVNINEKEQEWINTYINMGHGLLNATLGRPQKEKDPSAKQAGVLVDVEIQMHPTYQERVKYISFSQYVRALIRKDIGL